ncbi:hypothetical protein TNCV_2623561 [Trichonephila clavipes]|nr:hypothetical protein TNCV_2623561 [Trichonephila clavipes]
MERLVSSDQEQWSEFLMLILTSLPEVLLNIPLPALPVSERLPSVVLLIYTNSLNRGNDIATETEAPFFGEFCNRICSQCSGRLIGFSGALFAGQTLPGIFLRKATPVNPVRDWEESPQLTRMAFLLAARRLDGPGSASFI